MSPPMLIYLDAAIQSRIKLDEQFSLIKYPEGFLFVSDVQQLIMNIMKKQNQPDTMRWCNIDNKKEIKSLVFVAIENVSSQDFLETSCKFSFTKKNFSHLFQIFSPLKYKVGLFDDLLTINERFCASEEITNNNFKLISKAYQELLGMFPIESSNVSVNDFLTVNKSVFSRLDLLLRPIQLLEEEYPILRNDCIYTKEKYKSAHAISPMFALDCEMVKTTGQVSSVAKISIVNENCELIYHTLVKPKDSITNYLTKYSGITKAMLDHVDKTLESVQSEICQLLPQDAILCGHSLNNDLKCLKMMHPYVIDTSTIYNITGSKDRKAGLKNLADIFLNMKIQNDKNGHDPTEDCIATMKLVQLKLEKGLYFGNCLIKNPYSNTKKNSKIPPAPVVFSNIFHMTSNKGDQSFVGRESLDCIPQHIKPIIEISNQKVFGSVLEKMSLSKYLFCQFKILSESRKEADDVDQYLKQIYEKCELNTLFIAFFSSSKPQNNGLCAIKMKK